MDLAKLLTNALFSDDVAVDLYERGKQAREGGKDRDTAWGEVCEALGFERYTRTPARERFEDGFYGA